MKIFKIFLLSLLFFVAQSAFAAVFTIENRMGRMIKVMMIMNKSFGNRNIVVQIPDGDNRRVNSGINAVEFDLVYVEDTRSGRPTGGFSPYKFSSPLRVNAMSLGGGILFFGPSNAQPAEVHYEYKFGVGGSYGSGRLFMH